MNILAASSDPNAISPELIWLGIVVVLMWIALGATAGKIRRHNERKQLMKLTATAIVVGGLIYWLRNRKKAEEREPSDIYRMK